MTAGVWSTLQRLRSILGPSLRPEPTRACPTLADTRETIEPDVRDMGYVSLAAIRRVRQAMADEPR